LNRKHKLLQKLLFVAEVGDSIPFNRLLTSNTSMLYLKGREIVIGKVPSAE